MFVTVVVKRVVEMLQGGNARLGEASSRSTSAAAAAAIVAKVQRSSAGATSARQFRTHAHVLRHDSIHINLRGQT